MKQFDELAASRQQGEQLECPNLLSNSFKETNNLWEKLAKI
jgi:hypothetical protein